jgi:hypothetical protein
MTCGITCPVSDGTILGFFLRWMCGVGSWIMCSPLSLVAVIFGIVVFYFVWSRKSEESRDRIGIYAKIILAFLLLAIFFEPIKAFLFTSPYVTIESDPCGFMGNEICIIEGVAGFNYADYYTVVGQYPTASTNYWTFSCSGSFSDKLVHFSSNATISPTSLTISGDIPFNITVTNIVGDYSVHIDDCPAG